MHTPAKGAAPLRDERLSAEVPKTQTITQAMKEFDRWSPKRKRMMARRMAIAGFFEDELNEGQTLDDFLARLSLSDVEDAYSDLLLVAANKYAAGIDVSPQELLKQHESYRQRSAQAAGQSFGSAPGEAKQKPFKHPLAGKTTKTRQRVIDVYSPEDAKGLARSVLQRELGRDPTEEEFADFVSALNEEQRDNPSVTKTITEHGKRGQVIDRKVIRKGGMGANAMREFATDWAESQPGAAEWQAIGTYFPAAINTLGSTVPGA